MSNIEFKPLRWQVSKAQDSASRISTYGPTATAAHAKDAITDQEKFALVMLAGLPTTKSVCESTMLVTHTTQPIAFEKHEGRWVIIPEKPL